MRRVIKIRTRIEDLLNALEQEYNLTNSKEALNRLETILVKLKIYGVEVQCRYGRYSLDKSLCDNVALFLEQEILNADT